MIAWMTYVSYTSLAALNSTQTHLEERAMSWLELVLITLKYREFILMF